MFVFFKQEIQKLDDDIDLLLLPIEKPDSNNSHVNVLIPTGVSVLVSIE
jgi:hypothetical protein